MFPFDAQPLSAEQKKCFRQDSPAPCPHKGTRQRARIPTAATARAAHQREARCGCFCSIIAAASADRGPQSRSTSSTHSQRHPRHPSARPRTGPSAVQHGRPRRSAGRASMSPSGVSKMTRRFPPRKPTFRRDEGSARRVRRETEDARPHPVDEVSRLGLSGRALRITAASIFSIWALTRRGRSPRRQALRPAVADRGCPSTVSPPTSPPLGSPSSRSSESAPAAVLRGRFRGRRGVPLHRVGLDLGPRPQEPDKNLVVRIDGCRYR